jgi:hypothetical protein
MRWGARESGQVAVEAALVMPLFVFLILGIMQMGLIAQARVMAKYAAYRAARVGAMNNADPDAIEAAAIFHLLPVLVSRTETILPTGSTGDIATKFARHMAMDNYLIPGSIKQVKTVICSPIQGDLDGSRKDSVGTAGQTARKGLGSNNEVDFDDPMNQSDPEDMTNGAGPLRRFNRTRLVVQVQFLYRMPIPFANWVILNSFLGTKLPSVLMMPGKNITERKKSSQMNDVATAALFKVYALPINVSYAMRMQSNLFLGKFKLPTSNECVSYGHPGY